VRVAGAARLAVRIERCTRDAWHRAGRRPAQRRGARTGRTLLTLPAGADLRVTAVAGGRKSAPLYLEGVGATTPGSVPPAAPPPSAAPTGRPGSAPVGAIVDLPISFTVRNVNGAALACSSDGQTYRLHGHLVAPAATLAATKPAITFYLHEFGFGEWFWRFPMPAYDYATQEARLGHASVVIDRLGYDSSPGPEGTQTCLGAQADMVHQAIGQLRAGSYQLDGSTPVRFGPVTLAGHSLGGLISEVEAYSFGDIDALALFAWADQGFSEDATADGLMQGGKCAQGGEPAEPGGPGGYAYFASSPDDSRALLFHDAEPAVIDQALALRNRDPCGDVNSEIPGIALDNARVHEITVPVLLVFGEEDATMSDPHSAAQQQQQAFTGSHDVTLKFVPDASHALTLERAAPTFRGIVSDWLAQRGF
jgi:pimeloyl-ACP methyl ester carboxylesterase